MDDETSLVHFISLLELSTTRVKAISTSSVTRSPDERIDLDSDFILLNTVPAN